MANQTLYARGATPALTNITPDRPRVGELMVEAVEKPLTIVTANVGYGKTKAVSTLYDTTSDRILWIQLTKLDNLAPRLWERICFGIEKYNKPIANELMSMGFPETIAEYQIILRRVAEGIAKSSTKARFVLVMDDFHVIYNKQILEMIELAASAKLMGLSIVVIANEEPDLNLTVLREKGLVSYINQDDLCLTKAETAEYLFSQGVDADDLTVNEIYEWTLGWTFAIYLIGLSLKAGGAFKENIFSREILDIFSLIEDEIYKPMSANVRRFLLKMSILDNVPPILMKILAESDLEIIKEVERHYGSLLYFDPLTGRYRVMNLFRKFIMEKHNDMTESEEMGLYKISAKWHHDNDNKLEAIAYYKAYGDYNTIFDIIHTYTQRMPSEMATAFIALIDEAPREAKERHPIVLVTRSRLLINNKLVSEAYEENERLLARFEAMPESESRNAMLGEIYIMSGVLSMMLKTLDFTYYFKVANILLPEGSRVFDRNMELVGSVSFITMRDLGPGSVSKMTQALFDAMPSAVNVMHGCGAGLEYMAAAEAEFMSGDMKNAERNAYAALYKAQPNMQYDIEYMAMRMMLRLAVYYGDYTRAAVTVETVGKFAKREQTPDCRLLCDVIVNGFYAYLGKFDRVADWIIEDYESSMDLAPITLNKGQWIRARFLLNTDRYSELLGYLDGLDSLYHAQNSLLGLIENAVLRSIAYHYSGEKEKAIASLYDSYKLSYENNIIMVHVEFGKWMRTVARMVKLESECPIPQEWIDMIYSKSSTYAKRVKLITSMYEASHASEERRHVTLSKREKDVLLGLCQGLTREQIAESYGISINTVKGMLPIVFDKLGATNSLDAVRIAATLDLLPTLA